MALAKVTFTLDEATVRRIRDSAEKLAKPQSAVVREAVREFYDRMGKLSEQERLTLLRAFDELVPKIPHRSAAFVGRELAEVRRARRAGGRRSLKADDRSGHVGSDR